MRFKPPPPSSDIGWRVEFRSTEVQVTDFENAAYACFIVLLARTILSRKLNLYMPLSAVHANMNSAQRRSAVLNERFAFRTVRMLGDAVGMRVPRMCHNNSVCYDAGSTRPLSVVCSSCGYAAEHHR